MGWEDGNLRHRRDPQAACGVGCSKVTLWDSRTSACDSLAVRQWPREEEPTLLWVFPWAEHQPGFLQTVRMFSVLEVFLSVPAPKMAKWFLFLHGNVPCSQVLPIGFISAAALTLTSRR